MSTTKKMTKEQIIREIFLGSDEKRTNCRITLLSLMDDDLEEIQQLAKTRYKEGKTIVKTDAKGNTTETVVFDTFEGNLALSTIRERLSMLGIGAPQKMALTDPSGEREFKHLTDEELDDLAYKLVQEREAAKGD